MNAAVAASPDVSRARADALVGWLREYAAERINSRLMDERRCLPPYIVLDFGNRGLLGMQAAERYGGLALRHADHLRVLEQLGAIDQTLAAAVFIHGVLGTRPIQGFATPAVRDELMPRLAAGRELAAFALSEPAAGSNVGGIASEARPDGRGGWLLRGVKRWNSSAWAGVTTVFCRVPGERGRPGGLTAFVVRQGSRGLRIGPEALTLGLRAIIQNTLIMDDVPAGPDDLLGTPGRGMEVAEDTLIVGRLGVASVCLGGIKRCVQLLARYGARREVASGRLLDNPVVLATLGELTALADALEVLRDQVAERLDAGQAVPPEVAMAAKIIASEGLNRAADRLIQFLGGRGYLENNLAPQVLRDARLWSIGEGPNEPLTIQIGRKARHTDAIAEYLGRGVQGAQLWAELAPTFPKIAERCLSPQGPFADRSTAQVWTDSLIGRLTCEAILLAAVREAHGRTSCDRPDRALGWSEERFAQALRAARDGLPEHRLIPTVPDVDTAVGRYAAAIGDIEQGLAGADEALDPYLCRTFDRTLTVPPRDLPGEVVRPAADDSVAENGGEPVAAKRALLAQVLRRRLEESSTKVVES